MSGKLVSDELLAELYELVVYKRRNGLWSARKGAADLYLDADGIEVKNTEATEIPAYGCMEVAGSSSEDGRAYVTVKKPTSSGVLFVFNSHTAIEASGYGVAQSGPVIRAYKNTGTVTLGNRWAPTAGQYYLTKGAGPYVVVGEDDIASNVFRVVRDDVARLYRFTLNASLASGTADADILEMDGTDTGIDATVRDPAGTFATLVTVGDSGQCLYQDGKYWVIQADCPA